MFTSILLRCPQVIINLIMSFVPPQLQVLYCGTELSLRKIYPQLYIKCGTVKGVITTFMENAKDADVICTLVMDPEIRAFNLSHNRVAKWIRDDFNFLCYFSLHQDELDVIFKTCKVHLYTPTLCVSLLYVFQHGVNMPASTNLEFMEFLSRLVRSQDESSQLLFHYVIEDGIKRGQYYLSSPYQRFERTDLFMLMIHLRSHSPVLNYVKYVLGNNTAKYIQEISMLLMFERHKQIQSLDYLNELRLLQSRLSADMS